MKHPYVDSADCFSQKYRCLFKFVPQYYVEVAENIPFFGLVLCTEAEILDHTQPLKTPCQIIVLCYHPLVVSWCARLIALMEQGKYRTSSIQQGAVPTFHRLSTSSPHSNTLQPGLP